MPASFSRIRYIDSRDTNAFFNDLLDNALFQDDIKALLALTDYSAATAKQKINIVTLMLVNYNAPPGLTVATTDWIETGNINRAAIYSPLPILRIRKRDYRLNSGPLRYSQLDCFIWMSYLRGATYREITDVINKDRQQTLIDPTNISRRIAKIKKYRPFTPFDRFRRARARVARGLQHTL